MAFSAQTDHGQCERKEAVLGGIYREKSRERTKVRTCYVTLQSATICIYVLFSST